MVLSISIDIYYFPKKFRASVSFSNVSMIFGQYFGIIKPLEKHTTYKHARKINNPTKRSFQGVAQTRL